MSTVTGQASSNDGTIYNSYHQAGTAQSFCETMFFIFFFQIIVNYVCISVGK